MNNLARVVIEEYPKNNFAYQISQKLNSSSIQDPPCFKEFSELIICLNKTDNIKNCMTKYECFVACFKK